MTQLAPYPQYKDSGLPWLGEIPAHWQVRRAKYLLRESDVRSIDGQEQLLSVSQYTGVTPRRPIEGGSGPDTRAKSLVGYKRVSEGELVINIMLAWNGSLGVASSSGIVSPAYCVYRFAHNIEPWYYYNLFKLQLYKDRIKASSSGVVDSRLRLYSDDLYGIEAILPPVEEQSTIAAFLNHFDRRINRLIRDKRRMIALLNEQKQAIINQAVTRGLDPNVRLKPSGIDWLGDVPDGWAIWKIGYFAKVGNGSTPSRSNLGYWSNGTYPWLNSANINHARIAKSNQFVTDLALRECHLPKVSPDSVLVAITGQGKTRGMSSVLDIEATINQHLAYISIRTSIVSSDFLQMYLQAAYKELRAISEASGSTRAALTCQDIKHFKVAVPPKEVQEQLLSAVKQELDDIETTSAKIHQELDLLREYRTRLIADVVTGKLDVRGLELPAMDVTEALEELDLPEDVDDVEVDGYEEATEDDE